MTKKAKRIEQQQVPFPLQVSVCSKGNGMIALAEFCAVGVGYQGEVKIVRLGIAEEALRVDLPGRRGKKIGATHHLVDARFRAIHHYGQLVNKRYPSEIT